VRTRNRLAAEWVLGEEKKKEKKNAHRSSLPQLLRAACLAAMAPGTRLLALAFATVCGVQAFTGTAGITGPHGNRPAHVACAGARSSTSRRCTRLPILRTTTALQSENSGADGSCQPAAEVQLPTAADRLSKLQAYAQVFAEEGVNGDMRVFNVYKVETGDESETYTKQDRLKRAQGYAELFSQPMSVASRVSLVDEMQL